MRNSIPRKAWYFTALLLPVVAALVAWFAAGPEGDVRLFIIGPIYAVWRSYLLFAILLIAWGWNKPAKKIWRLRFLLPFLYYPLCIGDIELYNFGLGQNFGLGRQPFFETVVEAFYFLPVVLVFGYAYVLLGIGVTYLLTKAGMLHD